MKNAGIAGGLVAIGIGLATIGLSNFSRQAEAVPAVAVTAGPEEPTIVWYDFKGGVIDWEDNPFEASMIGGLLLRAWSDGTIEGKLFGGDTQIAGDCIGLYEISECLSFQGWFVISSPTEGLNAAADINFDEIVDGADMGLLLGNWGKAPRSPIPASDCPLGLMQ